MMLQVSWNKHGQVRIRMIQNRLFRIIQNVGEDFKIWNGKKPFPTKF